MHTLKWFEPGAYVRAQSRVPWWVQPLATPVLAGVLLAFPLSRGQPIRGSWPFTTDSWLPTIALTVVAALVVCYVLPFLLARVPSVVEVNERGVSRAGWRGGMIRSERWSWEQLTGYTLRAVTVGPRSYDVLTLYAASGQPAEPIALDVRVSRDVLQAWFTGKRVGRREASAQPTDGGRTTSETGSPGGL
jgi:hypothetical protein